MAKNYLDKTGLALVWEKIKNGLSGKVDKVDGKGLSSNDYTSTEKTKLANVASGAQVNVLEGIQKNGDTVQIVNKIANISVPTKTSDITNDSNFAVDASYVHTDNNYTTADKTKLGNIEAGADVNIIESVKVNGTTLTPDANKAVNVTVPTKTSDITNDSGFITTSDIPEGAAASTTTPAMDGTATVGTELAFARGDHVHPTDTSRAAASDVTALTTRVGDLETAVGTGGSVDSKISSAIAGLDSSIASTSNQAIASVTLTDGKITGSTKITVPTNNNQLTNGAGYQTASDVSTAISEAIADITSFEYEVVQSLPAEGEAGVIYLVAHSHGTGDSYDEYIWVSNAFEKIGNTDIDLSGYVLSSDLVAITSTEINTICV